MHSNRISYSEREGFFEIQISIKSALSSILILTIITPMFMYFGFFVTPFLFFITLSVKTISTLTSCFALALTLVMIGFAVQFISMLFWTIRGKEVVTIYQDTFSIKHTIFGVRAIGFALWKTRNCKLSEITNLKFIGTAPIDPIPSDCHGRVGDQLIGFKKRTICCTAKEKSHCFGILLDENEAQDVIKKIQTYLAQNTLSSTT